MSYLSTSNTSRIHYIGAPFAAILMANLSACSEEPDPTVLAPVEETRPTEDDRILNGGAQMSDGSPVAPYMTMTLETNQELTSDGLIGGMTMDRDGNLYVADFGTHIWRVFPDGETVLLSSEFDDASGNFALGNGEILQSEWTNNRIYKIGPDGSRELFSDKNLDGPVGIVRRHQGDFIVANWRSKTLARIPAGGGDAEIVLEDPRMTQPNGVTIDEAGNIYIADLGTGSVFQWTPDGKLNVIAELPGKGNAHNVYVDGKLYVNKIWDHAVYVVDVKTGAYGLVSGNGRAGYKDGMVGVATLEEPNAITASHDGKSVYVSTHRGRMGRNQRAYMVVREIMLEK